MIISNHEIAIHINIIRNLTNYTFGRFELRISVADCSHNSPVDATPVNIIEKDSSKPDNRPEFDQTYYITKAFPLKSGSHVEINEICIFKLNAPFLCREGQLSLRLLCQLVQVDSNKNKVVGTYKGSLTGSNLHQYLEMDFYETAPCQVIGSIHCCQYKFEFVGEQNGVDLRTYCQKLCKFDVDEILEYLQKEGVRSYKFLAENYSLLTKKEVQINCCWQLIPQQKVIQLKNAISLKDVAQRETQFTEPDEEIIIQPKKRRPRIFSISKDIKTEKYQVYQTNLHQNAQKIYQLWRQLIGNLFTIEVKQYFVEKSLHYRTNLKQKTGQSVVSFRGSWDIDTYSDQEVLRNKLAHQLRNQDKQIKDLRTLQSNYFNVLNQAFFSNLRPIFFQQKAVKCDSINEPLKPAQILVILVHGLGACRFDMQKIKVELKRYYDAKVKVYSSSANEGRTEGDIDSMGLRLAAQIDYELNKYTTIPKICLLGHSMGGLIIRSALPRLQKYKQQFHSFITLSSPHVGYAYSSSKLVDAGLWVLNIMKKSTSILQMTMQDHQEHEQTFLYKLSRKPGLDWFKRIILLASHQDLYVPYYSARIQKNEESNKDNSRQVKKGVIYCEMIDNILEKVKGSITRLNVNFSIPEQNFDNLIGRAAHIHFINNVQMVRTLVLAGNNYFF